MLFLILMNIYPKVLTLRPSLYLCIISFRKYLNGTHIYSGSLIGIAKKWSFISKDMNLALLVVSNMVLLIKTFVSSIFKAGDPVSSTYTSLSPPTTMRILYASYLSG